MGTWHLTDQFLFFTDRDTLLPLLLFSLLWNTAAPSQCFPGQGVFTSAQLYQRRAVICWWEAGGFSTVFPLQGTPRVHGRTAEDCAGASTIACPSASAQMLLQENMEDPAGGGLYGVPGAFSQRVILGRLRSGWAAGLRYRAAWCRSSGRRQHITQHQGEWAGRQQATGGACAEVSAGALCSSDGCRTLAEWTALWFRHHCQSALLCTPRELCQVIDFSGTKEPRPQLIRT